jgi:hypothetical protein
MNEVPIHPQGMHYGCNRRRKPSASTSGKTKGIRANTMQRYACKHNRAHRILQEYASIVSTLGRRHGAK